MRNTRTITILSMMLAIAIVLNVIEMQINIIPVPNAKIGFANIVTVIVFYMYGFKETSILAILRVLLVGLLYRSFTIPFWMGLGGAILSVIIMGIFKKWFKLHIVTVSVFGAIFHTIGQVLVGMYLLQTDLLILYLTIMLPLSVPAGIITGIIAKRFLDHYGSIAKINSY